MMEIQPSERQPTGPTQSRLRAYMAGLLVLGAIVIGVASFPDKEGEETLPSAPEAPEVVEARAVVEIDRDRIPARDDDAAHATWQTEALAYLTEVSEKAHLAEKTTLAEVVALPFEAGRGRVFELSGRILGLHAEEYPDGGLIWVVVLEDDAGRRLLVVRRALASDPAQGRPEDALQVSTEYLQPQDRVLVRGIYAQRRVGTWGLEKIGDPVPVLVLTPSGAGFRKIEEPKPPIADVVDAAWETVEDRYLRETKHWAEPALFEVLQWAQAKGHDAILEDIRAGKLKVRTWDQDTFVRWSEEVESAGNPPPPRPFTDAARGALFRTTGLLGSFVYQGWDQTPRSASTWDVHRLYTLDIQSDHYANKVFRTMSAFPLEAYEGITGKVGQHLAVYGFFLKNYTFSTRKVKEEGGRAEVTLPFFVVVHAEPLEPQVTPYGQLMWIIAAVIVVLAVLFYLVLVRGERKEAARLQSHRAGLRKQRREKAARKTSDEEAGPAAPPADDDS